MVARAACATSSWVSAWFRTGVGAVCARADFGQEGNQENRRRARHARHDRLRDKEWSLSILNMEPDFSFRACPPKGIPLLNEENRAPIFFVLWKSCGKVDQQSLSPARRQDFPGKVPGWSAFGGTYAPDHSACVAVAVVRGRGSAAGGQASRLDDPVRLARHRRGRAARSGSRSTAPRLTDRREHGRLEIVGTSARRRRPAWNEERGRVSFKPRTSALPPPTSR